MGERTRGQGPMDETEGAKLRSGLREPAAPSFATTDAVPSARRDAGTHEEVLGPVLDAIRDLSRSVAGYESLGRCLIDVVDTAEVGVKERHAIAGSLAALRDEVEALRHQSRLTGDAAMSAAEATRRLLRAVEERSWSGGLRLGRSLPRPRWVAAAGTLAVVSVVAYVATGSAWFAVTAILGLNIAGCLALQQHRSNREPG